jgi:type II secretory pathway pseudopilin PulG
MKVIKRKRFTLLELVVIIAIIGILITILLPSLNEARLSAQSAVCKSNMQQIYRGQMLYAKENNRRVWSGSWGSSFLTREFYQPDGTIGSREYYHGGQAGFLVPYLGEDDSLVYNCPASYYDKETDFYRIDQGKSYEGFMDLNASKPEFFHELFVQRAWQKYFLDASRKPFFWDYTAPIGVTTYGTNDKNIGNSQIHGNKGRINLAVSDGSVVSMKLPIAQWTLWVQPGWVPFLEEAVHESAY